MGIKLSVIPAFNVSRPDITAAQQTVFACEKITVEFSGARGWEED